MNYSRAGNRVRGSVKDEPPGRASHLYPMERPAGLYAQAHYKGAPLKGLDWWVFFNFYSLTHLFQDYIPVQLI